ncbi:hypothetical protein KSP39_PZI001459 [Platanthera zijinensis]|uniref:Uncharacterized protein n=1 Tax=Platanthera zijinensis TaxID=2320716 RepID=A0AAP0C295_9ASPA
MPCISRALFLRSQTGDMERNNGCMKLYWKRRTYERLEIGGARRRREKTTVELGGGRRRRSMLPWKVKILPKLQFLRSVSPKRALARFNEGYIRIMQRLAGFLWPAVGGKELGGLPEPVELTYHKRIVERERVLPEHPPFADSGIFSDPLELARAAAAACREEQARGQLLGKKRLEPGGSSSRPDPSLPKKKKAKVVSRGRLHLPPSPTKFMSSSEALSDEPPLSPLKEASSP